MTAAQKGEPIPEGWAKDESGNPTTDAGAAMQGTLMPIGGAKGAALALMVEILAASLTGSNPRLSGQFLFRRRRPASRHRTIPCGHRPRRICRKAAAERLEKLIQMILEEDGYTAAWSKKIRAAGDGGEGTVFLWIAA